MKIAIVCGSQRKKSNSQKVGKIIEEKLKKVSPVEPYFIDLGEVELPFWDEDAMADAQSHLHECWRPINAGIESCQGLVFVCPEWGGMVPPVLKNFFLFCTKGQIRHKPALIVTLSTGIGGSYPIPELRISSYKNTGVCYIPDQVILRNVNFFFSDLGKFESEITKNLNARLDHALAVLVAYAKALVSVRESGLNLAQFSNGM